MCPALTPDFPDEGRYCLAQARVPVCLLGAPVNGASPDSQGDVLLDIHVADGRLRALRPAGTPLEDAGPAIALRGRQVWPLLVDMHAHLDKGQVIPRVRADGSIAGAATASAADRARWDVDDLRRRMRFALRAARAHGVGAIRTHLDANHPGLPLAWQVFQELRAEWAGRVTLQGVVSGPLGLYHGDAGAALADLVARGGGILGGVTDAISTVAGVPKEIEPLLARMLALAAERGLDIDLHVDQSDDTDVFALPAIARAVLDSGFRGKVVCGHCVNLALQDGAVAEAAISLARDAALDFVTLPAAMMHLMDRRPGRTPRWRGVTAVHELRDAGLRVAVGGDNCRDAWYPYGDHDMVETFREGVRVLQLDALLCDAPAHVARVPADILGLPAEGRIQEGGPARLIIFSARTLNELMCRPQSDRVVIDGGRFVTDPLPDYAELDPDA